MHALRPRAATNSSYGFSPAVSGGSDSRPMESLSLNFERIKG